MKKTEALIKLNEFMQLENKSPKTIESYNSYVSKFLDFCYAEKFDGLEEYVKQYALTLKWKKFKSSTINLMISAVRYFCAKVLTIDRSTDEAKYRSSCNGELVEPNGLKITS